MQAEYVDTDAQKRAIAAALNATGIPWRDRWSVGHTLIVPRSNLKPWTPAEESALMAAVTGLPYGIHATSDSVAGCVKTYLDSRCYSRKFETGHGFRIYSRSA